VGRAPRGRHGQTPWPPFRPRSSMEIYKGAAEKFPRERTAARSPAEPTRDQRSARCGQLGRNNGTNGRRPTPTRPRRFGGAGVQDDRWCRRPPTRAFEPPLDRTTVFRPRTHGPSVAARFFDRAPNRCPARPIHHRSRRSIRSNTFPFGSGQMTAFSCAIQSPGGSSRAIAGRSGSVAASAYRQNGCEK